MTNADYIYNTIKDLKGKTPVLLVGGAMITFKLMYKGNIYRLENTEDIKDFITNFSGVDYRKPIVIEDISMLYRDSVLLKFIEDTRIPLVLLASEDNISIPLQSRIKTYIKFPIDDSSGCNFQPILDTQAIIDEKELTGRDLDKYIAENCPQLALIYKDIERRKNKDKLIQIIGGIKDGKLS